MAQHAIATDGASIDLRSDGSASPNEHAHIYENEADGMAYTIITDDHAPVPSGEAAALLDVPEDQVSWTLTVEPTRVRAPHLGRFPVLRVSGLSGCHGSAPSGPVMTTGPRAVARVLRSVTMRSAVVSAREHLGAEHRCTAFTTDHGLATSEDGDVFGAAVCPHCGTHNALTGPPADFREQVMRCMKCTRVLVLDAPALVAFATEVADDE